MAVTARISTSYRVRLGAIALLAFVFCLVPSRVTGFLYDGMIRYPERQQIYLEWEQLREERDDWRQEWQRRMAEHGYPERPTQYTDTDIAVQYLIAAILGVVGLVFLFGFVRTFGRWVAIDDDALTANGGHRATFDRIESVDADRWDTKGIAIVHYRDDADQLKRITLDDWKFEREPTQAIYQQLRQKLAQRDGQGGPDEQDDETSAAVDSQGETPRES